MKLTWLRAAAGSFCESGEFTVMIDYYGDAGKHRWGPLIRNSAGNVVFDKTDTPLQTREAAEAACEAWLDQHDKPVWQQPDGCDFLWWCNWRGYQMAVRDVGLCEGAFTWGCRRGSRGSSGSVASAEEAKAAAEKYVREQTR